MGLVSKKLRCGKFFEQYLIVPRNIFFFGWLGVLACRVGSGSRLGCLESYVGWDGWS